MPHNEVLRGTREGAQCVGGPDVVTRRRRGEPPPAPSPLQYAARWPRSCTRSNPHPLCHGCTPKPPTLARCAFPAMPIACCHPMLLLNPPSWNAHTCKALGRNRQMKPCCASAAAGAITGQGEDQWKTGVAPMAVAPISKCVNAVHHDGSTVVAAGSLAQKLSDHGGLPYLASRAHELHSISSVARTGGNELAATCEGQDHTPLSLVSAS